MTLTVLLRNAGQLSKFFYRELQLLYPTRR